jgi:hypothetical protein
MVNDDVFIYVQLVQFMHDLSIPLVHNVFIDASHWCGTRPLIPAIDAKLVHLCTTDPPEHALFIWLISSKWAHSD